MASIKRANDNEITEQVVERLQANEAEREAESRRYREETDSVCELVRKGKVKLQHPEYFAQDAFVRLVAEVPQQVAIETVKEMRFKDKYPCLTSFAIGLISGALLVFMVSLLIVLL